jgi:outer membrane protein assembly factor BamB
MRTIAQAKLTARGMLAVVTALVALFTTLPMVGCGGGSKSSGGSSVTKARGGFTFAVQWPSKTRVIPLAAESIQITLERTVPGPTLQPIPTVPLLTKPADIPRNDQANDRISSVTVPNLELGTYRIVVTAYPAADGTGTPVAVATVEQPVVPGANAPLTMTMDATVTAVDVTPSAGAPLFVGKKRQFTATMFDASGNVVMVDPQAIAWTATPANIVTVDTGGLATLVGAGTGTVKATYKEPYTQEGAEGTGDFDTATIISLVPEIPWGKFRGNDQNTGKARFGEPTTGVERWQFTVGGSIVFSSPSVDENGAVYVGAYDGNLYAFEEDGTPKWTFPTGDAIDASPTIGPDGTIYVGSFDGNMYAINRDDGTQKWKFEAEPGGPNPVPVIGSAALHNGVLYFGTGEPGTTFYAVNAETGAEIWSRNIGTAIQTCPAFSADYSTLYVGGMDGNLYSINAASGATNWAFPTTDQIYSSSPAVGPNGTIYVGSLDGGLYAVTPGGTQVQGFPVQTGTPIYASPAINTSGNSVTVYFGTFDTLSDLADHRLFAINGLTGEQLWSVPFNDGFTSSAAIGSDGTVYVGNYNGLLYAINPDGSQKWAYPMGSNIDSSPAIGVDGNIYVGDFGGKFVSLF